MCGLSNYEKLFEIFDRVDYKISPRTCGEEQNKEKKVKIRKRKKNMITSDRGDHDVHCGILDSRYGGFSGDKVKDYDWAFPEARK